MIIFTSKFTADIQNIKILYQNTVITQPVKFVERYPYQNYDAAVKREITKSYKKIFFL